MVKYCDSRIFVTAFKETKNNFDPHRMVIPWKIPHSHHMNDHNLFRYKPRYLSTPIEIGLDWPERGYSTQTVETSNNSTYRIQIPGVRQYTWPSCSLDSDVIQHLYRMESDDDID